MTGPASSLRVLYVIDSLAAGGAERSLAALAPLYGDLGVILDVAVLFDRPGLQDELRGAGAQIHSVTGTTSRVSRTRQLAAVIGDVRPDLVHTTLFESDVTGRIAARLAHVPVASSLVNEAYGPEHALEPGVRTTRLRAAQALDAATARLTTRMHAVSEQVAMTMSRRLQYPRARISVVPRGRDPSTLGRRTRERRSAARAELGATSEDVIVLAVGRQEPQKALDSLVGALGRVREAIPRARLVIAGREGAATDAIQSSIASLGADRWVTLLGERTDVPELLCAADVFVLPSRREGMPGSVIEAMALEVPVVASDLPQVREVTGSDAALLAEVDDAEQFAGAISSCIDDPDAAQRRVALAYRRFLDQFTIDRTAHQMVAFYHETLSQPRRRWRAKEKQLLFTGEREGGGADKS
jgi:glycosyltransferase involved in cell wall biosynthesis